MKKMWAGAAMLAVILAGCTAPAAQPAPTRSASAAQATPETSPPAVVVEAPAPLVDELVLRPSALELRLDGAVVTTLDYMSPAADAIAALTTAFGYDPTDEPYEGTNHRPPGVFHAWGPVVVDERFYDEDRRAADDLYTLDWPRFAVYFDAPMSGDIALRTLGDHRQGEPWAAVLEDPESAIWACDGTPVEVEDTYNGVGPTRVTVIARADEAGGSVGWLGAPAMEAQGCA